MRTMENTKVIRVSKEYFKELEKTRRKLCEKTKRDVSITEATKYLATKKIKKKERGRPRVNDPLSFLDI